MRSLWYITRASVAPLALSHRATPGSLLFTPSPWWGRVGVGGINPVQPEFLPATPTLPHQGGRENEATANS